jgi:uncharacterized cupredoxin-like copper-binding protein
MKIRNPFLTLATACLVTVASAGGSHSGGHEHSSDIGQPGQAGKVSRSIAVEMSDTMRFAPNQVAVEQGQTIRFVVKNSGKLKHEFVMGTVKALKAHYALMKKFPEMEHAERGAGPNRRAGLAVHQIGAGGLCLPAAGAL